MTKGCSSAAGTKVWLRTIMTKQLLKPSTRSEARINNSHLHVAEVLIPGFEERAMARRPGSSSQSQIIVNGSGHRGDSPASTLAAQIVNRISTTSRQPHSGTGESFEQLLLEILASDGSTSPGNSTVETNAHVNCRLVHVVTRAGIEVLLIDDPFSSWDHLLSQASTSLAVIDLTIQRTPDVLYLDFADGSAAGIPLFLWLMPKLLAFIGVQEYGTLQDKLAQILSTALSAKPSSATVWQRSGPMLQYFQECVEGT